MAINKNKPGVPGVLEVQTASPMPVPRSVNDIKVGMGDIAVSRAPDILTIIGLGSCVGVAFYYPKERIGGLAHIMLPDSTTSREKFADTGLAILLDRIRKAGAEPMWMTARLIGGASMFKTTSGMPGTPGSAMFNIGENNVHACREFLRKERIKIIGEEVLGSTGRTMRFDLSTGKIYVRYADGTGIEL
ncbi:MAG: Chemoreceptor glutamine deamidase CheD [Methanocella sp. PtaU1.Bin125]|nr:MAG: Chemoreceptor glutamine deamidase CheD [Methanocella sp. PtaU1.Bin125]